MCCENHAYFRPGTATSRVLTDDRTLQRRLATGRPVVLAFTVTWAPVRTPVTIEDPVAQPVLV